MTLTKERMDDLRRTGVPNADELADLLERADLLDRLRGELARLRAERDEHAANCNDAKAERDRLRADIARSEATAQELSAKAGAAIRERDDARTRIVRAEADLARVTAERDGWRDRARARAMQLGRILDALHDAHDPDDGTDDRAIKELASLRGERDAATARADALARRVEGLEGALRIVMPNGHYGRDSGNAPCSSACLPDGDDGYHEHRPDIGVDQCDAHPDLSVGDQDCLRCIGLAALAVPSGTTAPLAKEPTDGE